MSDTPGLSNRVQQAMAAFVDTHSAKHPTIAAAARELDALPLWYDWAGGVAIRPDGELVEFTWDAPDRSRVTTNAHFRFLAYVVGARRYADLADLEPARRTGDRDCPACQGTGLIADEEATALDPDVAVCYCGGAGWLPEDVPNPPGS